MRWEPMDFMRFFKNDKERGNFILPVVHFYFDRSEKIVIESESLLERKF